MKYFLITCFLFIIGAIIGWCIELIFRRTVHHKWINPGFLIGPYLPLYGFGVVILYWVTRLFELFDYSFLGDAIWAKNIIIILVMSICMTLIEYITGLIFIKKMNIKLWDYSSRWGNIQGIICPLFSLAWTAVAAIYLLLIDPTLIYWVNWLVTHLEFSFGLGMIGGIMLVDVCYSFQLSAKIKKFAKENKIIVTYENFKEFIHNVATEEKQKHHFMLAFRSSTHSLKESLVAYKDKLIASYEQHKQEKNSK